MALSELVALETAYRALQPLEVAARRRGLRWLTDALEVAAPLEDGAARPAAAAGGQGVETSGHGRAAVELVASVEPLESAGSVESASEAYAGSAGNATAHRKTRQPRRGRTARSPQRQSPRSAKAKASGDQERVYRRMPPADEVLRAYGEVGTISGLAEYFGVPRHTVQGWARRLRGAGYQIGRGA